MLGGVVEEVKGGGGGVCVLGKQGFVGCDCLIPGGLSFHSSSRLIPHHGVVVRAAASLGSGTCLAPPSPPRLPDRSGSVLLLTHSQRERERESCV